MNLTVEEILKLVGNGGGLVFFVLLVFYMMRESKDRELRYEASFKKCQDEVSKNIDRLSNKIDALLRERGPS